MLVEVGPKLQAFTPGAFIDLRVSQPFEKRTAFSNHGELRANRTHQQAKSPSLPIGRSALYRWTPQEDSLYLLGREVNRTSLSIVLAGRY
jgi:hypothetical protein